MFVSLENYSVKKGALCLDEGVEGTFLQAIKEKGKTTLLDSERTLPKTNLILVNLTGQDFKK